MPRSKPWDMCREPLCRNPTWSRKKEPLLVLRHCIHHRPFAPAPPKQESEPKEPPKPPRLTPSGVRIGKVRAPRTNLLFLPLVCVFKPYLVIRDPLTHRIARVAFTSRQICGAHAPRRLSGDRSLPQYPNRFGEPLCKAHKHRAEDVCAFPDDSTILSFNMSEKEPEEVEERER